MSALVINTDDKQVTQNEQPKLKTDNKYVVLCETNDNEMEQWYYFIKLNGNEEALQHLQSQLEKVDMTLEEELSTFDLDLDHTSYSYNSAILHIAYCMLFYYQLSVLGRIAVALASLSQC